MQIRLTFPDGRVQLVAPDIRTGESYTEFICPQSVLQVPLTYIDFLHDAFTAETGDPGYFVTAGGASSGTMVTYFTPRANAETVSLFCSLGCYGRSRGTDSVLGIFTGMRADATIVLGVENGHYYTYPRFYADGDCPTEAPSVRYYTLPDGDYSVMARCYRAYQLSEGGCVPLRTRAKADPRLKRALDGIEVRIRQGWKPVPTPVEDQTPDTEPPMHVACTFDRAGDIISAFHNAGIPAEFCLVGWNIGGHDGRFPQIFPPDPRLGGEARLRALIEKAHALGYPIVCHDDATAAYTVADCWDEEYILKQKDGSLYRRPYCWSGGRPHKICPRRQYERFESVNMPVLHELGFEGIHYIDVITILELLKCYDSAHPLTRAESAEWYRKIMHLARTTFGGFSSEGGFDFAAAELDYVLYTSYQLDHPSNPLHDEAIPFWQIVYHGIISYNPGTFTLNYPAKKTANRLKYFEYGGRPLAVYYANFAQNNHWMGIEDFLCDTDAQLADSVRRIHQMADDYEALSCVRYAFMDRHERVADGIFRTVYSNGVTVTVDYTREQVTVNGKVLDFSAN